MDELTGSDATSKAEHSRPAEVKAIFLCAKAVLLGTQGWVQLACHFLREGIFFQVLFFSFSGLVFFFSSTLLLLSTAWLL